jgi:hypothetical protein
MIPGRRIHLTRGAVTAVAAKHGKLDHHPGCHGRRPRCTGNGNVIHAAGMGRPSRRRGV